jgi:putative mRNA 3-end processing factor
MSGLMSIRGARRRRSVDRGFVLSDHVDWPSLMASIAATSAERVLATHGYTATLVRHLREQGMDADVLGTPWEERDAVEIEEIAEP